MINKNLYSKELKRNRKNLWIWSGIAIAFTFMIVSIYPSMQNAGKAMADSMPEEMLKAFGMDVEKWKEIMGYYKTYFGFHIILIMSIYVCSTGANIISKEERDKTSEFLFSKPISRKTIFTSKVASLFTLTLFIFSIQTISCIIGIILFDNGTINWETFISIQFNGLVLITFFGGIGLLISMLSKPKKNFMGLVVGVVFTSYFIYAISKSVDDVNWLGYFSPFYYSTFDGETNFYTVLVFIFLLFSSLILSYKIFHKKDIEA